MSTINLQQFCANKWDCRDGLHSPFRFGRWVYATNGHMAVRVPTDAAAIMPEADTEKCPTNVVVLFDRAFAGDGEYLVMPKFEAGHKCGTCDGTGEYEHDECIECSGRGIKFTYQPVGDAGFDMHYLHILSALPVARIKTDGPKNVAAVIFDGGQAIIMPMRGAPTRVERPA